MRSKAVLISPAEGPKLCPSGGGWWSEGSLNKARLCVVKKDIFSALGSKNKNTQLPGQVKLLPKRRELKNMSGYPELRQGKPK